MAATDDADLSPASPPPPAEGRAGDGPPHVPAAVGAGRETGGHPVREPGSGDTGGPAPELLVITGVSGAGRSTAAHVLEDLGWYVVDNLPPQLIAPLTSLATTLEPPVSRVGVVVDVRGRALFSELDVTLGELRRAGTPVRMLFLDATDDVLVRRFDSVRRPHPLQGDGRILDGIAAEREQLRELRARADTVIDTSQLNVHQLAAAVGDAYGAADAPAVRLTLLSFGFKYGIPVDADNVADVRFLPNPFWVPALRPHTGLDAAVRDYVLSAAGAREWLERYVASLEPVLAGYARESKRYATVAVGCTGGKHRSVALTEALAARLRAPGVAVSTLHRDLGRE